VAFNGNTDPSTDCDENNTETKIDGTTTTKEIKKYNMVLTMRVERFFSTILEDRASLSEEAARMVEDEQYSSFFTTCGANYIRSLRRAQEMTAIFTFESDDFCKAQEAVKYLQKISFGNEHQCLKDNSQTNEPVPGEGPLPGEPVPAEPVDAEVNLSQNRVHRKTVLITDATVPNKDETVLITDGTVPNKDETVLNTEETTEDNGFNFDTDIAPSLSIEILGFGLGLNQNGSNSLFISDVGQLYQTMKYAFAAMVKSEQGAGGLVYTVEVSPWTDNAQFLHYAEVNLSRLTIPKPRVLIENSRDGTCLSSYSEADDYGKCCDEDEIVIITVTDEEGESHDRNRCEPQHSLSPVAMKTNIETNAEFLSWIGSVANEKITVLNKLNQCASALSAFPESSDYYFVHAASDAMFDETMEMAFTVNELKAALAPNGNMEIISMLSAEHDEFFEMFYQPCLSAIYGINASDDQETDPKYFMAAPWYSHPECQTVSCLEPNKAWDRQTGRGCVDGLLARRNSGTQIPTATDPFCAKTFDRASGQEICKYAPDESIIKKRDDCAKILPQGKNGRGKPIPVSTAYLMDYFCMPTLDDTVEADEERMKLADYRVLVCTNSIAGA
jgi:hypothetical protein